LQTYKEKSLNQQWIFHHETQQLRNVWNNLCQLPISRPLEAHQRLVCSPALKTQINYKSGLLFEYGTITMLPYAKRVDYKLGGNFKRVDFVPAVASKS